MIPVLAPPTTDNTNQQPRALRLWPVDASAASAADRAFDTLRNAIVTLQLLPGERLVRTELSQQLGFSLTPLREAILRLEAQGLVETRPQAETRVALIDKHHLFELQFMRVAVETDVVRCLAGRAEGERSLRNAKNAIRAQATAIAMSDDVSEKVDRSFHAALFQAIGMERVFSDLIERYAPMQRCQNVLPVLPDRQRLALDFHRQILARILARDAKGAVSAMRAHLSDESAIIGRAERTCPDWFC